VRRFFPRFLFFGGEKSGEGIAALQKRKKEKSGEGIAALQKLRGR
jgi:hypothetical protein